MLSLREQIVEQLSQVPETRLQEVLRFVRFMAWPTQTATQASDAPSLELLTQEVEAFFQEPPTKEAQNALDELCTGIFESDENVAGNHDAFLYGVTQSEPSS